MSNKIYENNKIYKMTTIVERIRQIIEHKRLSERYFCREIGVANGFLNKVSDVGSGKLNKILHRYPEINPIWLLTGNGSMLVANIQSIAKEVLDIPLALPAEKGIPLITEAALRRLGDVEFSIQETDVQEYYIIPKFKHRVIDFMIEVSGSGMYPKYNSGDIVACTIIRENTFIQWNKTYVIVTKEQDFLIKRIKKSANDEVILAVSDNENYEPFEIPKKAIIGIAIVAGVIRLE